MKLEMSINISDSVLLKDAGKSSNMNSYWLSMTMFNKFMVINPMINGKSKYE
jgi:hypothetical protein